MAESNYDDATFEAVLVLYLACGKLTDGDLDPGEVATIVSRAHAKVPGLAPSYADVVIRQVVKDFSELPDPETRLRRVVLAAERVANGLESTEQEAVVRDLIAISEADGEVSSAEREFVLAVAKTLGVSVEADLLPESG